MTPRPRAAAAALLVAAVALTGCAPGVFDPTSPTAADEAPWAGGTPTAAPSATNPGDPAPSGDGGSGDGSSADPQPSEVDRPGPSVPPSAIDGGPALLERGGRLVLALDAREGCEPLLGRVVQEPATWTVQMLVQPDSACTGGATVATYELPGGDRPQQVVVDLGGERTTLDVP